MPNLLLKRNTNAGVAPTAGALSVGELAINAADSLLYTKDSGGTVRKIGGLTAVFTGDAQTLTNKVLTSPALGTSLVLNQATANYTITWANPAAARSIALNDPGNSGSQFVLASISSPSSGDVIKYNGTAWINAADATAVPGGSTTQVQYNSNGTFAGSANLTYNAATLKLRANSANIQEWQNSGGTVLAAVDSAGELGLGTGTPGAQLQVNAGAAATIGQIIRGFASQTANLTEWQSSAGTVSARISANGSAEFNQVFGGPSSFSALSGGAGGGIITPGAAYKGFVIRGSASQSANLQEWQNSAGTALAAVGPTGSVAATSDGANASSGHFLLGTTLPAGHVATSGYKALWLANACSLMASTATNYEGWTLNANMVRTVSDWARQDAARAAWHVGALYGSSADNFFIQRQPTSGGAFVDALYVDGVSGGATFGPGRQTAARLGAMCGSASQKGLVVRGYASQTANLQEWQNSAGTVLANVNSLGGFVLGPPATTGTVLAVTSAGLAAYNGSYVSAVFKAGPAGDSSQQINFNAGDGNGGTIFNVLNATTGAGRLIFSHGYANGTTVFSSSGVRIGSALTFVNSTAQLDVFASAANKVGAIVKGFASQSANLTEWQNSAGTVLASVTSAGAGSFSNGLFVSSSNGNYWNTINSASYAMRVVPYGPSNVGVVVKGAASQTANLQEWQDSTGAALSFVRPDGGVTLPFNVPLMGTYSGGGLYYDLIAVGSGNSTIVGNLSKDTTIRAVTYVTLSANGNSATYNGAFYPTADRGGTLGTSSNRWTSLHLSPTTSSNGIIITPSATLEKNQQEWQNSSGVAISFVNLAGSITAGTAAANAVPLVVEGFTGQTANLQQWRNSIGAVLASVTSAGVFTGSGAGLTGIIGGSTGQLQYNNAGAFDGTARLTYAASGTILAATPSVNSDRLLSLTQLSRTINISTIAADAAQNVTAVTSTAHGLQPGQLFSIAGSAVSLLNTAFIVATVVNSTTFTFGAPWTVSNISTTSDTGVITATDSTAAPLRISSGVTGGYVQIWGDGSSGMVANPNQWFWAPTAETSSGGRYPIEVFSPANHSYPNRPVTLPWMSYNGILDSYNCPARIAYRRAGVDQCALDLGQNLGSNSVFNLWVGDGYNTTMTRAISVSTGGSVTLANYITFGATRPYLQVSGTNAPDTNANVLFCADGAKALVLQSNFYHATNTFELQTIGSNTVLACITYQNKWVIGGDRFEADGSLLVIPLSAATKGLTVRGFTAQSENLQEWQSSAGTVLGTVSENGYCTTRLNTAPADAELANGEAAYWFDSTNGAAKFMIKAKQANGTVVTGQVSLT